MVYRFITSYVVAARTQATTLAWLAYYDFTRVYVANMLTSLKSIDVKNAFYQSPQYICVHQHGDRNTIVSGKSTEIYGATRNLVAHVIHPRGRDHSRYGIDG